MSAKYCLPVPVFYFWPKLAHPQHLQRGLCYSWATCDVIRLRRSNFVYQISVNMSIHGWDIATSGFLKHKRPPKLWNSNCGFILTYVSTLAYYIASATQISSKSNWRWQSYDFMSIFGRTIFWQGNVVMHSMCYEWVCPSIWLSVWLRNIAQRI